MDGTGRHEGLIDAVMDVQSLFQSLAKKVLAHDGVRDDDDVATNLVALDLRLSELLTSTIQLASGDVEFDSNPPLSYSEALGSAARSGGAAAAGAVYGFANAAAASGIGVALRTKKKDKKQDERRCGLQFTGGSDSGSSGSWSTEGGSTRGLSTVGGSTRGAGGSTGRGGDVVSLDPPFFFKCSTCGREFTNNSHTCRGGASLIVYCYICVKRLPSHGEHLLQHRRGKQHQSNLAAKEMERRMNKEKGGDVGRSETPPPPRPPKDEWRSETPPTPRFPITASTRGASRSVADACAKAAASALLTPPSVGRGASRSITPTAHLCGDAATSMRHPSTPSSIVSASDRSDDAIESTPKKKSPLVCLSSSSPIKTATANSNSFLDAMEKASSKSSSKASSSKASSATPPPLEEEDDPFLGVLPSDWSAVPLTSSSADSTDRLVVRVHDLPLGLDVSRFRSLLELVFGDLGRGVQVGVDPAADGSGVLTLPFSAARRLLFRREDLLDAGHRFLLQLDAPYKALYLRLDRVPGAVTVEDLEASFAPSTGVAWAWRCADDSVRVYFRSALRLRAYLSERREAALLRLTAGGVVTWTRVRFLVEKSPLGDARFSFVAFEIESSNPLGDYRAYVKSQLDSISSAIFHAHFPSEGIGYVVFSSNVERRRFCAEQVRVLSKGPGVNISLRIVGESPISPRAIKAFARKYESLVPDPNREDEPSATSTAESGAAKTVVESGADAFGNLSENVTKDATEKNKTTPTTKPLKATTTTPDAKQICPVKVSRKKDPITSNSKAVDVRVEPSDLLPRLDKIAENISSSSFSAVGKDGLGSGLASGDGSGPRKTSKADISASSAARSEAIYKSRSEPRSEPKSSAGSVPVNVTTSSDSTLSSKPSSPANSANPAISPQKPFRPFLQPFQQPLHQPLQNMYQFGFQHRFQQPFPHFPQQYQHQYSPQFAQHIPLLFAQHSPQQVRPAFPQQSPHQYHQLQPHSPASTRKADDMNNSITSSPASPEPPADSAYELLLRGVPSDVPDEELVDFLSSFSSDSVSVSRSAPTDARATFSTRSAFVSVMKARPLILWPDSRLETAVPLSTATRFHRIFARRADRRSWSSTDAYDLKETLKTIFDDVLLVRPPSKGSSGEVWFLEAESALDAAKMADLDCPDAVFFLSTS